MAYLIKILSLIDEVILLLSCRYSRYSGRSSSPVHLQLDPWKLLLADSCGYLYSGFSGISNSHVYIPEFVAISEQLRLYI